MAPMDKWFNIEYKISYTSHLKYGIGSRGSDNIK